MTDNNTNNRKTDVLRVFDYALSKGEIELVLQHDKSKHESDDHPCCPVCRDDMVNIADSEESNE